MSSDQAACPALISTTLATDFTDPPADPYARTMLILTGIAVAVWGGTGIVVTTIREIAERARRPTAA
jgi:hypothetical protein